MGHREATNAAWIGAGTMLVSYLKLCRTGATGALGEVCKRMAADVLKVSQAAWRVVRGIGHRPTRPVAWLRALVTGLFWPCLGYDLGLAWLVEACFAGGPLLLG